MSYPYRFSDDQKLRYLAEAERVAGLNGTCTRANVGALLFDQYGQFRAYGVNQDTEQGRVCNTGQCPRGKFTYAELPPDSPYSDCVYDHAEVVAVGGLLGPPPAYWAPAALVDWSIFVTHKPCHECAPMLDKLGIVAYFNDETGLLAL